MYTQIRQNSRDQNERRVEDRRNVDFKFGSPEWIKHVQKDYFAWPKEDRRKPTRRAGERRQSQSSNSIHHDYSSDLLTQEERLFFDNLFFNNKDSSK